MAFRKTFGRRNVMSIPAAATLVAGGLSQFDEAGEAIVAVTAKGVLGINLAAETSSTVADIDVLYPGDIVYCDSVTGTIAASEIGNECDIASETGVTLTESNGDAIIVGVDGTTGVYLVFKNLAFGSTGAGLETT